MLKTPAEHRVRDHKVYAMRHLDEEQQSRRARAARAGEDSVRPCNEVDGSEKCMVVAICMAEFS